MPRDLSIWWPGKKIVEMGIACMAALVKHGHSVSATKAVVGTMEYLQRCVETMWALFEVVISRPLGSLVSSFLTCNWYNQEHLYCHDQIAASFEISIGLDFAGNGCSKSYQICLWSTGQTNAVHRGWNLSLTATNWWIGFTYRRRRKLWKSDFWGRTWNGMHIRGLGIGFRAWKQLIWSSQLLCMLS